MQIAQLPPGAALKVLVVDDDRALLRAMGRLLDGLGFKPVTTANGMDALKFVEEDADIDLVLADFSMAPMDGADLAGAIQAMRPGLPVVIMTGHDDIAWRGKFSAERVLRKPFTAQEFEQRIQALTKR